MQLSLASESRETRFRHSALSTLFVGLLFIAGNLSSGIYPVFVTSIINSGLATQGNVGIIATAEFLPFGLVILFASKFMAERNLRPIAAGCLITHLLMAYLTTELPLHWLVVCRALFGTASGLLIWIAYAFVARSHHAGRLVAIYTTILMILGVIWSWVGPAIVEPLFSHHGVIMFLTVPSLLALILLPFWPDELEPLPEMPASAANAGKHGLPKAAFLILLSVGAWTVYMSIFWVYSEPLSALYSGDITRHWLTASLLAQIAGAGLAAILAERLPFRATLTVGLAISILHIISIQFGVDGLGFLIWTCIYGFLGYFLVPFYVAALVKADPTRRSIVFFPAAQYLSGSLGPLLVSQVVSDTDLSAGLLIDLAAISFAPLLFWIAMGVHRGSKVKQASARESAGAT
jgi:MFS transporter, DHA1 family, inner membrane transport protein